MTLSETYISRKQLLADNLEAKGVTGYSANNGLTTLINAVLVGVLSWYRELSQQVQQGLVQEVLQ